MFRFISISRRSNSWKIHVPRPDGSTSHLSVGYVKVGEDQGLRLALVERDKLGKRYWGRFWQELLTNPNLLYTLPRTVEPMLCSEQDKYGNTRVLYRAYWNEINEEGIKVKKCRKRSVSTYGYEEAYNQCKALLMEAHKESIPLIKYMKARGNERFKDWVL